MPPAELAAAGEGAIQFSPLVPGAAALEAIADGSLGAMTMLAPPGTIERRYALAQALRALAPGAAFTALAPKGKGGSRLAGELVGFGCKVSETARHHHRICRTSRPEVPIGLAEAIDQGGLQRVPELGLWSQPGVFSWNRLDPGSRLLIEHLPRLSGRGADFGCGIGLLAKAVLQSPKITQLTLVDLDRRAVEAARRNVEDARTAFVWADLRTAAGVPADLDFVVMNPPFHDGGAEDRALGQAFVRRAAASLRKGGVLWLTANRHLPYEEVLREAFARAELKVEGGGYKVYEARK